MVGYNADGPTRDRVMQLIQEKDRIESEIREQTAILETNRVGMHEPLVDQDGFPRNDIDVFKVRHARHQIICLQNDHKNIMKRIERGLADVHADLLVSNVENQQVNVATTSSNGQMNGHSNGDNVRNDVNETCFATVGFVNNGSPADMAGLCEYDEIIEFGSINHLNFRDMTQIMDLVGHSVNQRINVKIRRNNSVLNVTVIPKPWLQPGLLGCQILRKSQ